MKIYIAAPVNHMSWDEVRARNRMVAAEIRKLGHEPVDPLEPAGDYLNGETGDLDRKAKDLGVTSHDIVMGCISLIRQSDAILVYLPGFKAGGASTWGSPMELMYAYMHGKKCAAVVDDFHSAWLETFANCEHSLERAVRSLEHIHTRAV